tara:strand:+ start:370 stop:1512 length:1143 start_codon:yes stop_codon:yes gene_type:complete
MSTLKVNTINASTSGQAVDVDIKNPRSFRNLVINGAMQVSQRGTSFSGTAQQYTLDRMQTNTVGNDEIAQTEQAAVTSGGAYTSGFRKCMKIINGNQTSGAGSSDLVHLKMVLEAQDIANSGWNYTSSSSYVTLSFWIKSSVAQDFPITLRSEDGTRQVYNMTTGSLSAGTWTKITKTISGDSNLQFDDDVNAGLTLFINAFVGTDYTTAGLAQNAWSAWSGTKQGDNMTSTWYTTNNATLEITGLQLEVGSVATDFEFRSFEYEFQRCLRYYEQMSSYGLGAGYFAVGYNESTTQCNHAILYKAYKRATPTVTTNGDSNFKNHNTGSSVALSNLSIQGISPMSCRGEAISSSSVLSDGGCSCLASFDTDDAIIKIDAEL